MDIFKTQLSLRWADLDPNFHLRHSVYYDFGSQHRIQILEHFGLTMKVMHEQSFGPVLFREECVFKKEIRLSDTVFIETSIKTISPDGSRWAILHQFKNNEEKLYALLTVEGAWIDTKLRKLASPTPEIAFSVLSKFPTENKDHQ